MKEEEMKIELTLEQKEQLKKKTGRDVPAVRLCLEELEQRITPKLAAN